MNDIITLGDLKNELEAGIISGTGLALGAPPVPHNRFQFDLSDKMRRVAMAIRKGSPPAISTGFVELDQMAGGGIRKGELWITAARTAMGKSAFMLTQAMAMARRGHKVAYISLEMPAELLIQRMLVQMSQVPLSAFRWDASCPWRKPDEIQMKAIGDAMRDLKDFKMELIDRGAGFHEIVENVQDLAEEGCEVIIIDGLWLIRGDGTQDLRIELKRITGRLKELAIENDIAISAVHQINRSVEKATDQRPGVADLRDASIEDDADMVCALFRPATYIKGEVPEEIKTAGECVVLKNRNGETGTAHMKFTGQFMLWENLTAERHNKEEEEWQIPSV